MSGTDRQERKFPWAPADRVTEPIYAPTLEMETAEVTAGRGRHASTQLGWKCTRCGQPVGELSTGHYFEACQVTGLEGQFHFCCPGSCELRPEAGALHGTRPDQT